MADKLKINMISESTFTVQGHGVHTAFIEMTRALRARPDIDLVENKFRPGADITHIHTVGIYGLLHLLMGSGKKVVSAHVVPESFVGSLVGAKYWYGLAQLYLRFFYGRADMLFAVSGSVKDILEKDLKIKKTVQLLDNTIDISRYKTTPADRRAARTKLHIDQQTFVVVGNGQIQPRKRFDVFCKLAQRMPDAVFIWVGGIPFKKLGADHRHMQELIDTAPKNLRVTGVVKLEQVRDYLQASDVMFMPSVQETFGLAIIEAAACGLPIVVRDIADYDTTFGDNVIRGNGKTFRSLIERLRDDANFRQHAHQKSTALAKQYDSTTGIEHAVGLYRRLLSES